MAFEGIDPKPPTGLRRDDMLSKTSYSNITILLLRIEAGTGGVVELPVTIDLSIGVQLLEHGDQGTKRHFLIRRARVLGTAVLVEPADVADADAVGVAPAAVRACLVEGTTRVYLPVQVHHKVVTDAKPAALAVVAVDVGHRHRPAFRRGGAVHDDLLNPAHRPLLSGFDGSARRTSC